jgi:hypothetical protein
MSRTGYVCDARIRDVVSLSSVAARVLISAIAASVLWNAPPAAASGPSPRCATREPRPARPVLGGGRQLVPSGAAKLLLCRYRGLNSARTALRLRWYRLLTGRTEITSIATALDKLPRAKAAFHCPMDDGSAILATFAFAARRSVTIRVGLRGCRTVTGPYLPVRTAISPGGARLVATLERLVP